jgi:hypothetical protein
MLQNGNITYLKVIRGLVNNDQARMAMIASVAADGTADQLRARGRKTVQKNAGFAQESS